MSRTAVTRPIAKHISIFWSTSWPAAAPVNGDTVADGVATVLLAPYGVAAGPLPVPVAPMVPIAPTALLLLLVGPVPGGV